MTRANVPPDSPGFLELVSEVHDASEAVDYFDLHSEDAASRAQFDGLWREHREAAAALVAYVKAYGDAFVDSLERANSEPGAKELAPLDECAFTRRAAHAIAQLRHLYAQMLRPSWTTEQVAEAAKGLLGPAIADLERTFGSAGEDDNDGRPM